jgi:thiosulfate dehydrogenase
MTMKSTLVAFAVVSLALGVVGYGLWADEFTDQDVERWQLEYMSVVEKGRALWGSPDLGTNGVACGQCHPNAANTHPETYPKYQQQLGMVVELRDMINWCIQNPLEGETLPLDDPRMIALEAYIAWERRGVPLAPGKH